MHDHHEREREARHDVLVPQIHEQIVEEMKEGFQESCKTLTPVTQPASYEQRKKEKLVKASDYIFAVRVEPRTAGVRLRERG